MIAECVCREAAIASWAQRTDFAANLRPVDWLITHTSEVTFKTDTMSVIFVLHNFSINMEKQGLNHLCSAYRVASRCPAGYSPCHWHLHIWPCRHRRHYPTELSKDITLLNSAKTLPTDLSKDTTLLNSAKTLPYGSQQRHYPTDLCRDTTLRTSAKTLPY